MPVSHQRVVWSWGGSISYQSMDQEMPERFALEGRMTEFVLLLRLRSAQR